AVLGSAEAAAFLAPKPVTFIFGVGKATQARLARDGYRTLADLQKAEPSNLMRRFGTEGLRLARLAHGVDTRPVRADRETKSVSAETTFEEDVAAFRQLEQDLWRLCERVSAPPHANDRWASSVTLKLETADIPTPPPARVLHAPPTPPA